MSCQCRLLSVIEVMPAYKTGYSRLSGIPDITAGYMLYACKIARLCQIFVISVDVHDSHMLVCGSEATVQVKTVLQAVGRADCSRFSCALYRFPKQGGGSSGEIRPHHSASSVLDPGQV